MSDEERLRVAELRLEEMMDENRALIKERNELREDIHGMETELEEKDDTITELRDILDSIIDLAEKADHV